MKRQLLVFAALGAALLACACDKKGDIETYTIPKTLAIDSNPASDADGRTSGPQWTVPSGWISEPGNATRFASFKVSVDHPEVELTVVPLGPEAGTLLQNVNRWQKQVGLPATDEQSLPSLMKFATINGAASASIDLIGAVPTDGKPQQRMLATIVTQPDATWFFKLLGPMEVVSAQKSNYEQFIQSLRFPPPAPPPDAAGPAGPPPDGSPPDGPRPADASAQNAPAPDASSPDVSSRAPFTFTTPPGWNLDPKQNEFRVMGFDIPAGNASAVVTVARMPAGSGTVLQNVNRWRGQVNLPPISDPTQTDDQSVTIDKLPAQMWDLQSPLNGGTDGQRIVVAMLTRGNDWWFFKLSGPGSVVRGQKENFLSFLHSVQFQGESQ